jgi:hypothetical protein
LLTKSLALVGAVVICPLVVVNVVKAPVDRVVAPTDVLLIVPPVNDPPVTVLPVKVSADGNEIVTADDPVAVTSFAVPDTVVTGADPLDTAVNRP